MSTNPGDIVGIARKLEKDSCEAAWRSCASRAYYGAFHAALAIAPDHIRNQRRDVHEKLICWLISHGKNHWKTTVGGILQQIRNYRTNADYKLSTSFPKGNGGTSVHLAEKTIAIILESLSDDEQATNSPKQSIVPLV